jgi:hypothetical protein
MSAIEAVSLAKDIIVSLASITGAIVAVWGVKTWRTQFDYKVNHKLGRRILKSLYQYRDALKAVRNMPIDETVLNESDKIGKSKEELLHLQNMKDYQRRFVIVAEAHSRLYADMNDAVATWGGDFRVKFDLVFHQGRQLCSNIQVWLKLTNPQYKHLYGKQAPDSVKNMEDRFIYDSGTEEQPDEFNKGLAKVVSDLESAVRKKMETT